MVSLYNEPHTWREMLNSPDKQLWLNAVKDELDSLATMKTWELVPRPGDKPVVRNRWIFKIKTKLDGTIDRYKARLVAKGYTQTKGIDYEETFSPVVKYETLRYLIALSAEKQWHIHQMDVKTAFLHGDLEELIYMEQPEGHITDPSKVCLLRKSLYGLKQSPRCWNKKFTQFLFAAKFKQSKADPCLFLREQSDGLVLVIAIYVDDLLITGNSELFGNIKSQLAKSFAMTDLGPLTHILGMTVVRTSSGTYIHQQKYITRLLETFNMKDCKALDTPAIVPPNAASPALGRDIPYMEAVGSLNYLATCSRPDLAFAVSQIARHMHAPTEENWTAVKRIFRYLQGTKTLCLFYSSTPIPLTGYSDASYAPEATDRKSTSGYVFMKNGGAISWKSKKQPIVSLSSMEAEYIALCTAGKEAIWLRQLEADLKSSPAKSIVLNEDNQAAIKLAKNSIMSDRSKHIDVRYHWIREQVAAGTVTLQYCPTDMMVADIFTKPLQRLLHSKFLKLLGLVDRA